MRWPTESPSCATAAWSKWRPWRTCETFSAGRLGKYSVGADGEVLLGEAKVVTPKNLDEFKF